MGMIKGITVRLHIKEQTGEDPFGHPVYSDSVVDVDNVLVGEPSATDVISANQMGKHISYTLGIPKTDSHKWKDTEVEFFGKKFRTVGEPIQGIDALVPLDWNRNVMVEAYE